MGGRHLSPGEKQEEGFESLGTNSAGYCICRVAVGSF